MSSSRSSKRGREVIEEDDDEEENNEIIASSSSSSSSSSKVSRSSSNQQQNNVYNINYNSYSELNLNPNKLYNITKNMKSIIDEKDFSIVANEKDETKWDKLKVDERDSCVKAFVRFILMKGSRNESISRTHLVDVLGKINVEYKKHLNMAIIEAKDILLNTFGYNLRTSEEFINSHILDCNIKGTRTDFYLTNNIKNPILHQILINSNQKIDNAYNGFKFIIFQSIYTSPGKKIEIRNLLRCVRKIDSRFPETYQINKKVQGVAPVPELGDDFNGLINRMKKEGFIATLKDDLNNNVGDNQDNGKVLYTLGSRFFSNMTNRHLLISYFTSIGEDVDAILLKEISEEELKFVKENDQEEKDKEN